MRAMAFHAQPLQAPVAFDPATQRCRLARAAHRVNLQLLRREERLGGRSPFFQILRRGIGLVVLEGPVAALAGCDDLDAWAPAGNKATVRAAGAARAPDHTAAVTAHAALH